MCNKTLSIAVACWCLLVVSAYRLAHVQRTVGRNLKRDFVPTYRDQRFIRNCLAGQEFEIAETAELCRSMLNAVSRMSQPGSRNRRRRDTKELQLEYIKDIVDLVNQQPGHKTLKATLKDIVAPCANYSTLVQRQWRSFYKKRVIKNSKFGKNMLPDSQEIDGNTVEVVFNPPSDRERFMMAKPICADLVLQRVPPCQIDERFGSYEVTVEQLEENRTTMLYQAQQASCPTMEGYLMLANLDLQPVWRWFIGNTSSALKLAVRIRPLEQIIAGPRPSSKRVNILRRIMALTILCKKPPGAAKYRISQPTGSSLLANTSRTYFRNKRHARRPRGALVQSMSACRRISYPVNFEEKWHGAVYPRHYDVGECLGVCSYPLSDHMNTTNHAIAMKLEQVFNPTPAVQPTVDCVPISLGDISELQFDISGDINLFEVADVVVKQCGCA